MVLLLLDDVVEHVLKDDMSYMEVWLYEDKLMYFSVCCTQLLQSNICVSDKCNQSSFSSSRW